MKQVPATLTTETGSKSCDTITALREAIVGALPAGQDQVDCLIDYVYLGVARTLSITYHRDGSITHNQGLGDKFDFDRLVATIGWQVMNDMPKNHYRTLAEDKLQSLKGQLNHARQVLNAGGLEAWEAKEYAGLEVQYMEEIKTQQEHMAECEREGLYA